MTFPLRPVSAIAVLITALGAGCGGAGADPAPLFEAVPYETSGLDFKNMVHQDLEVNMLNFEYLFNGGGVAIGDVDGDSLPDLFLTATQGRNRLFRNLGGLKFQDITASAGVGGRDSSLSTGATFFDADGDGDLDLHVAQTGKPDGRFDTRNLFYLNDGTGRFVERGAASGLGVSGSSTHAAPFDADGDGDLDLFVVNHPDDFSRANEIRDYAQAPEPGTSDRLYRNDGPGPDGTPRFTDISAQAGVESYAFGLSATVADVNDDGAPDILVANDYTVPDFLYLNNGDGTFRERNADAFAHTAASGMGSDIGDLDGDGLLDLVIVDMMAEDARRQRTLATSMLYDRYQTIKAFGYGDQVQRNVLQLNNGDGTFREVGQLAGIAETDWSWSPLLADFDLDGDRDLFVANGYRWEVTNLDYAEFTLDSLRQAGGGQVRVSRFDEYIRHVPSERLPNYAYANRGDATFDDVSQAWGLGDDTHSSGAAYADLDLDGDLDLVVNNVDGYASLYRNRAETVHPDRRWLRVRLDGPGGNPDGLGARVTVATDSLQIVSEVTSARGFLSSVEPVVLVGLGRAQAAAVTVRWPDGREQRVPAAPAGHTLTLHYADAGPAPPAPASEPPLFAGVDAASLGLTAVHREDTYVDFKQSSLLPHLHSREGPAFAVADVSGDGLDDVFVGGASGQPGTLFVQQPGSRFAPVDGPWAAHADREDTRAVFFDADGDGHADLYVASGGGHLLGEAARTAYQDRLYLGDGAGAFVSAPDGALPDLPTVTGAVAVGDADGDGDLDVFVGGRVVAGDWPTAPRSALLVNDGAGRFQDRTVAVAPGLDRVGMVTGAAFADVVGDAADELVIVGEWLAPQVWGRDGSGRFTRREGTGLDPFTGWWNTVLPADLDGDGDLDLVAGNLGLNSRIHATADAPVRVHTSDFDGNGTADPVLTLVYPDGGEYPIHRREVLARRLPFLLRRFPRYLPFASATYPEVFTDAERRDVVTREATTLTSMWFENDGMGQFTPHVFPTDAQVSPVFAALATDLDADGTPDLLLAGNSRSADASRGPYDALRGLVLRFDNGAFRTLPAPRTGLRWTQDVRGLAVVRTTDGPLVLAAANDGPVLAARMR